MAVLHEEVDTVLLERDGVGVGLGHALHDCEVFDVELKSSRRALVGADVPSEDDRGLLGEAFERGEDFGGDALDVGYALDGAGTVAKDGEEQLAALAQVVEPSAEGDGLAFMLAESGDGSHLRWGWLCFDGRGDRGGRVFGHRFLGGPDAMRGRTL